MLAVLYAIGATLTDGHLLGLGSLTAPTPLHGRFLALYTVFGGAAAAFFTAGLYRLLTARRRDLRLVARWRRGSDRKWILYGALFAFLLPALVRTYLLLEAPLTDDEGAYRLAAEILATGRLYVASPPLKIFFDNRFLINDGKLYTQYFLGWPALMVPGVWLGLSGLMNALYAALTVPAIFMVVRRLAAGAWARVAVVLFLSSPMLTVGAATETSHTSCLMALGWLTWFVLRSRDPEAPWWSHAGTAFFFSVAFFIRPASALGIGAPLLVWWLMGWRSRRSAAAALLAFALPALVMAALFFTVNKVQNGSFFEVAFHRYFTYAAENGYRFSLWQADGSGQGPAFDAGDPLKSLAVVGSGLFRLNYALLGWPCSLLFVFFSREGRFRRVLWASVGCFVALHFSNNSAGIDTYGPMHYQELALPALLLSVLGLRSLGGGLSRLTRAGGTPPRLGLLPVWVAGVMIGVSLAAYVPVRLTAIHRIAAAVHAPWEALREADLHDAVIFASDPFVSACRNPHSLAWVFVRPNNDPDLTNDVLWVNHLTVARDKELMRYFPDRTGYVMVWLPGCRIAYWPLAELAPGRVPDARDRDLREVPPPARNAPMPTLPAETASGRP